MGGQWIGKWQWLGLWQWISKWLRQWIRIRLGRLWLWLLWLYIWIWLYIWVFIRLWTFRVHCIRLRGFIRIRNLGLYNIRVFLRLWTLALQCTKLWLWLWLQLRDCLWLRLWEMRQLYIATVIFKNVFGCILSG